MGRGGGGRGRGRSNSGRPLARPHSPLKTPPVAGAKSRLNRCSSQRPAASAVAESNTDLIQLDDATGATASRLTQVEASMSALLAKMHQLYPTTADGDAPSVPFSEPATTSAERLARLEGLVSRWAAALDRVAERPLPPPVVPRSRQKRKYSPLDLSTVPAAKLHARFYTLKVEPGRKGSVNPYVLRDTVASTTSLRPKSIAASGRDSYTVEVHNDLQGHLLLSLTVVDGVPCTVSPATHLNRSRGIIYVDEYNIDDLDDFSAGIREHCNVSNVTVASFIKPRREQTTVFLLEFDQETPPSYIYIPGERSDTRVYPFHDKPLSCKKCHMYGHSQKRCNNAFRCGKCGQEGHIADACLEASARCLHCGGSHRAMDPTCPRHVKEKQILSIQNEHKVGKRRARQILEGIPDLSPRPHHQPSHFLCKLDPALKRSLSPWTLEKCLHHKLGEKPVSIRSSGPDGFVIHVAEGTRPSLIQEITAINNIPVTISEHPHFNTQQGLIFIQEYNLSDFERYRAGLIEEFGLQDAVRASWIHPRNPASSALLLTFRDNCPDYIDVPGEQGRVKVYEYVPKPMMCNLCLDYGHTAKHCQRSTTICGKCAGSGHAAAACTSLTKECHHCSGDHFAGSSKCVEFRYHKEILTIQRKYKLSRHQARIKLQTEQPHFRNNFAAAASSVPPPPTPPCPPSTPPGSSASPPPSTVPILPASSVPVPGVSATSVVPSSPLPGPSMGSPCPDYDSELSESELTSQNNPTVYRETKEIFDLFTADSRRPRTRESPPPAPHSSRRSSSLCASRKRAMSPLASSDCKYKRT